MYVWRIPLPLFASLVASIELAMVWIAVASLRRRATFAVIRGLLLGAAVAATALSSLVVHLMTRAELERMASRGLYVHYSPYLYLAPALLVALLSAICRLAVPHNEANASAWWKLKFWLVAFGFTVLNVSNWCSPGWCERFGFPLPYTSWSDAMVVMNGENLTAGYSFVALLANILVFLLLVAAMSASYRRSLRKAA